MLPLERVASILIALEEDKKIVLSWIRASEVCLGKLSIAVLILGHLDVGVNVGDVLPLARGGGRL